MNLSAGLLHTGRNLLDLFSRYRIPESLEGLPKHSFVASRVESVNIAVKCGWLELDDQYILRPSVRGREILAETDFHERMRLQIEDFIEVFQPRWSKLIPHGRSTAVNGMDPDSKQCFKESGLLEMPPPYRVVEWWDRLASKARGLHRDINSEIGRKGERLSIEHETKRVGSSPKWQAIESNADGYDLLSVISAVDPSRMTIEVKASTQSIGCASFHISRNEWNFARLAAAHRFHLWASIDTLAPRFACLSVEDVAAHIPGDKGLGTWESVEIPFSTVDSLFSAPP